MAKLTVDGKFGRGKIRNCHKYITEARSDERWQLEVILTLTIMLWWPDERAVVEFDPQPTQVRISRKEFVFRCCCHPNSVRRKLWKNTLATMLTTNH